MRWRGCIRTAGRNPAAGATEPRGTSSASSNPCSAMHYVLGAGWPGPSACRPAPTRHIIASSALEGLFGHMKDELFRGHDWGTFETFKADLEAYIIFWNTRRRQKALDGLTPEEFRNQAA
ncbi:IS3 family transposase [Olsenella kribbiana]|uniref:IS3 family transposase n=1 Tax=Olsenella kribbiana TaxID=3115221 RepID=UPI002ED9C308